MGMPNPFSGYPITDDWDAHRARGSLGGIDWGTPVGTPIYSPNSGTVTYEAGNGTGGYIITLALSDSPGYKMQFLHCSAFNGGNRTVKQGELLGYTGGAPGKPGAGSSTGPHVHVHLVDPNGTRENPLPWFVNSGSTPSGLAIDGDFGPRTKRALQTALGVTADGDFGPASTRALQAFLGITQDGDWGPATTKALQGFLGVTQDGSFGPQTVRALQASLNSGTFKKVVPVTPKPIVPPVTPVTPVTPVIESTLSPAKQKRLEKLNNLKKEVEAKLKDEKLKLPVLIKTQKTAEDTLAKVTDVFNKAKAALDKATADVVKSKNDRVVVDKGVVAQQATIASLEKDIAKYTEQISKIK